MREVKLVVAWPACNKFEEPGIDLAPNIWSGAITSGDFDNLGHKTTSNLSNNEFHEVAITLKIHFSNDNMWLAGDAVVSKLTDSSVIAPPIELK